MNIILAGIMGRHPYGGVAWCSLMYLLGLRRLGHQVWYLEDTGECNFDPMNNTLAEEPSYATNFIQTCLQPYDFADRWCYVDYLGEYHGRTKDQWQSICRDADLFLNLSGGCWFWRDEYAAIPHSAFIDSDPGFTQLAIAKSEGWYPDFFRNFQTHFTFGRNIGTPRSAVPTGDFDWKHTWQPISMQEWAPLTTPPRDEFTTIMSWTIGSFLDIGGNKDQEMERLVKLPARTRAKLELAISGQPPEDKLRECGWAIRDGFPVSCDLDTYRNYIRTSRGEFSVAKNTYVSTRSGWFSDRTECYLASGRPAVVQDTGFSSHIPTGLGLISYATLEEASADLDGVLRDYERHSKAAVELARAHFADDVVLPALLEHAVGSKSSRSSKAATGR
jgi:hypothetical protein